MPHPEADLSAIRTVPVRGRRVSLGTAPRVEPHDAAAVVERLPDVLAARDLRRVIDEVVRARRAGRRVLVMCGGHVVKVGAMPAIVDLVRDGLVTAVALNGAAAIHDVELALFGETSEDVQSTLLDGTFGMAEETGRFVNDAAARGVDEGIGLGEALGGALRDAHAPGTATSILAAGVECGIPVTVHVAVGTDITHQHPRARGEVIGASSFSDFRVLAHHVSGMDRGVVLNLGSAVVLPEVFLKALAVARNLGASVGGLIAADFDMIRHYRPVTNVTVRPTHPDGWGTHITGHHEIMIPLLSAAIRAAWNTTSSDRAAERRQ